MFFSFLVLARTSIYTINHQRSQIDLHREQQQRCSTQVRIDSGQIDRPSGKISDTIDTIGDDCLRRRENVGRKALSEL